MNFDQIFDDIEYLLDQFKETVFDFLPNFAGAVTLFIVGLLIARLVKSLSARLIEKLPRLLPNKNFQSRLKRFLTEKSVAQILSKILYWMLIIFFFTAATEVLGLFVVTAWLSGLVEYLPKVLAAILIGFFGLIAGAFLRDMILQACSTAMISHGAVLGRLGQVVVILVTVLIGVEQLGIDLTILTHVIVIVLAALLFGAALAFGLGARISVSNILASYYIQKTYKVGQSVKIADITGRIVQITANGVILDSSDGQVFIPAKTFEETFSVLLRKEKYSDK